MIIMTPILIYEKYIFSLYGNKYSVVKDITHNQFNQWLSGFIDGEGSFHVGLTKKNTMVFKFIISLHIDDILILYKIQKHLKTGKVYKYPKNSNCNYTINGLHNCFISILPLLNEFPLLTTKYYDFKYFSSLIYLRLSIKQPRLEGLILKEAISIKAFLLKGTTYKVIAKDPIFINAFWLPFGRVRRRRRNFWI